ncbi:MAG TPA: prolyl oligopeptidase family serine peptidase [Candidatus Saccharimonadales bacterium]|nr:prolyl oligopeptidase family serine peptidase [Candidatus Saccharimonadales bacterium]
MRAAFFAIIFFAAVFGLAQSKGSAASANGPSSSGTPKAKVDAVVDDYHGRKVSDSYRWLEDSKSAQTQKFGDQQNAHTRKVLDGVPGREKLRTRLEQLLTIGRVDAPRPAGPYYFYDRREGTQNQPIIYVREGLHGKDRALIDVNALAPDGTIALDWWFPSNDGKLVAYGTSPNGSEISTLRVIETTTGKLLPEQIGRTRAASVAWLPDNSGFYYTKYPRPGDVPAGQELYNRHVFFHALGATANFDGLKDPLIFGEKLDPEHWPSVLLSHDGRWLLVHVSEGWSNGDLLLKDLKKPQAGFLPLTGGRNSLYQVQVADGQLYITTNEGAPRYRVFKVACSAPQRENWKEIVPESKDTIEDSARVIGGRLFVPYIRNASAALTVFDLEGRRIAEVAMPTLGSINGIGGQPESQEGFFGFASFALPSTVYHVTLDGKLSQWETVKSDIDPSKYEVQQLWFSSKDGVRIPMFAVHKKGLVLNGKNPTVLSGYGGFNIGRTPSFNRNAMLLLLEHGGIYADAQLRGGSEFGEQWHRDGMLDKKQNTFDDFIAAAEYLIAQKYTDKDHLAIQGGSNGGLLMGAVLTQRPDLFRAVVCQVPLLDMLRYQRFQIAKLWIPEYGSSEDPKQFEWIYAYSPYHHVKPGTVYPAVLFMTADSDTRVDPLHAKKMTALMQAQAGNGSDRPILLRLDSKAGHGIGKPIGKLVEEDTDFWSFVFWQLGISN